MVHDFTLLASTDAVPINIPKVPIDESPSCIFVFPFVFLSLFWQGQPGSTNSYNCAKCPKTFRLHSPRAQGLTRSSCTQVAWKYNYKIQKIIQGKRTSGSVAWPDMANLLSTSIQYCSGPLLSNTCVN